MENETKTWRETVMSTPLLSHVSLYGEGWAVDLRSNFLIAVAERTLVQLPQSMIILQIFPLIVPVERNKVVRSDDSSDDRGNKQLRRRTRMLAPVSPAMASVSASC